MNEHKHVELTVSNRTIIRVIAIIVLTLFAFQFLKSSWQVLQLIFIAFFLSLALNPAVTWLRRKLRLKSRVTATAIAYLIVVAIISWFFIYVVPPLVQQTVDFVTDVPQTISNLRSDNSPLGQFIEKYNLEAHVQGLTNDLQSRTSEISQPVFSTATRIGSTLISTIIVFVLTFMMLIEGPKWIGRYWSYVPEKRRKHQEPLAAKMYDVVTGYVNGQLVLALTGATFGFVALMIVGTLLDASVNAIALAGILVITGLIPMIGNTIGGVIVVLSTLVVSIPYGIIMAIFFIVYQQIENVSLQPYIQSRYNEMSALLVFVAALLGAAVGGILGALIAIPLAGCAKILLLDFLATRKKEELEEEAAHV